jgi:hypothetical protein
MDNRKKLVIQSTQHTSQINVREYRRDNQQWTIVRNSLTFIQPRNISKVINKHIFNSLYTNSAVCRSIESLLYCGLILMSIMKHNKQKMFDRGRLHKVSKELQSCNDTIIHIL